MCVSTLCLSLAAYFSFRLIRVTNSTTAWALISMSIFVQIIRRLYTISSLMAGELPANSSLLTAELIALTVSAFLLIGTANIAPLFLSIQESEANLKDLNEACRISNDQLESRVKERTQELEKLNQQLNLEIQEHMKAKDALILKDRQAVVGQMAAGMAHEVKNPLTAVRGFAQILSDKAVGSKDLKKYAEIIIEEVDTASLVINNFLKLSRPSPPALEKILFTQVIHDVVELIRPQAMLNRVNIEIVGAGFLIYGLVDEKQMKQVFLNLCQNSIDAMAEGGDLKIQIGYEGEQICISISDSGCGIPKAALDKMFVPFFTTKAEGTGLGMFISQSIIQAHRGKIEIASEEGLGTKCMVYLPDPTSVLPANQTYQSVVA